MPTGITNTIFNKHCKKCGNMLWTEDNLRLLKMEAEAKQ